MNDAAEEPYRSKALEYLESARADLEVGRFNGAASRAYYAAYNAGIVALLRAGYRSEDWGHDEVQAQVAGQLIRRGKLISSDFVDTLSALMEYRLRADYGRANVSSRQAARSLRAAERFVRSILES